MSFIIRLAEKKDIEALAELDDICFAIPWNRSAFEYEINENLKAIYLVAELDDRIIGYVGVWVILDEGHITNIAVHPDFRNKGLGKLLLSNLFEITDRKGVERYTLEVRDSNDAALSLYSKFKFKQEGKRLKYYEDTGEDALILWR